MAESRVGPNSTGKEFEDASGLYYFGARWYDPQLGMWLTPDAAAQYLNPYAYGADPINGVDPDGNWFIIDDVIGAAVGAGVGAYTAYKMGYDLTDWETYALVGGGAAIGVASVYTAGAAAGAVGGGFAGAVAGGAAAGAVGSAANYTLTSGVGSGFDNFSASGMWDATWKGGASGAVGGGVAGGLGHFGVNGAASSFGSGFAGGATGAALNGAEGWDIVTAGLVGGGIGVGAYSAKWAYQNYGSGRADIANVSGGDEDVPRSPAGKREASTVERLMRGKFEAAMAGCAKCDPAQGEFGATYKIRSTFLLGRAYLQTTWTDYARGGSIPIPRNGADLAIHSHPTGHPNASFPSTGDYSTGFNQSPTTHYMYNGSGTYYQTVPTSRNNGIFIQLSY